MNRKMFRLFQNQKRHKIWIRRNESKMKPKSSILSIDKLFISSVTTVYLKLSLLPRDSLEQSWRAAELKHTYIFVNERRHCCQSEYSRASRGSSPKLNSALYSLNILSILVFSVHVLHFEIGQIAFFHSCSNKN